MLAFLFFFLSIKMQAEVGFLGQLHHPNLVKLIGYCIEDDQRLLVYEFMTRGSLENHLFRSKCLGFSFTYFIKTLFPFCCNTTAE